MADLLQEIEAQIAGIKAATSRQNVGVIREIGDGVAIVEGLSDAMLNEMLDLGHGITGLALMARAYNQAQKFGAEMAIPDEVSVLSAQTDATGNFVLRLSNDEQVRTHSVVIASGARYRRPAVPRLGEFEGRGIWYWASALEAKMCAIPNANEGAPPVR